MHCAVEALRTGIMEPGTLEAESFGNWDGSLGCVVFHVLRWFKGRSLMRVGAWICAQPCSAFYVIICIPLLLLCITVHDLLYVFTILLI